jgi:hypothetical protein
MGLGEEWKSQEDESAGEAEEKESVAVAVAVGSWSGQGEVVLRWFVVSDWVVTEGVPRGRFGAFFRWGHSATDLVDGATPSRFLQGTPGSAVSLPDTTYSPFSTE